MTSIGRTIDKGVGVVTCETVLALVLWLNWLHIVAAVCVVDACAATWTHPATHRVAVDVRASVVDRQSKLTLHVLRLDLDGCGCGCGHGCGGGCGRGRSCCCGRGRSCC